LVAGFEKFHMLIQEIAASFSGGNSQAFENGPAFIPGELCRVFHAASEKLLQHV